MIASLKNPRVAYARKLARRRVRDAERAFVAEGPNVVQAAVDRGATPRDLFVTEGMEHLVPSGLTAEAVTPQVMEAICDTSNPQGIAAIVEMTDVPPGELAEQLDLVLVLCQVRDPGNAGTLMRSAYAAGAAAVIFTEGSVDPFSPKVVRASAGTVFGPQIVRASPIGEVHPELKRRGVDLIGASATSERVLFDSNLGRPVAVVVGNEAWGFPEGVEELLDETLSIPMPGPVESLNAAVAGSLVMFEAVRQRRERAS